MDYRIIYAIGGSEIVACNKLEERVKFCLSRGWKPQGGVCITPSTIGLYYACQAMIKESQKQKN